ncbi:MAG: hypothetical protein LBQ44_00455 [Treponema sp.]|jgi:hypothetical protein|nr:hypothetical protein [Treponema sp.]
MNGSGARDGAPEDRAGDLTALIRRRIESRYRRLCFVQQELAKLDAAASETASPGTETSGTEDGAPGGSGVLPGSFEDFVFARIDFSIYKKIDDGEFRLLFEEGLDDYSGEYLKEAFGMGREEVRDAIAAAYVKIGPFRVCKKAGLTLLSIMRTLHSSLDFAPLFHRGEVSGGEQYRALIAALDGVEIRHGDGMTTRLFVPHQGSALCGTFHPLGKAHTLTLIPAPGFTAWAARARASAVPGRETHSPCR